MIEELPGRAAGVWSEAVVVRVAGQPVRADDLLSTRPQSLSGTVTDADTGQPVGGAVVNFSMADRNRDSVRTDAAGKYRLFVTPREVDLNCEGAAGAGYDPSDRRPRTTVGAGQNVSGIDFKIRRGPAFGGRVVLPDGTPARGVQVLVNTSYSGQRLTGMGNISGRYYAFTTDKDGRFASHQREVRGVASVRFTVTARPLDHSTGGVARGETTAADGFRVQPLEVTLARSAGVLVRVADPDGQPLSDARVEASNVQPRFHPSIGGPSKHLGDGRYLMTGLIPGLDYHLSADAAGFRTDTAVLGTTVTLRPDEVRDVGVIRLDWWGPKAVPGFLADLRNPDPDKREVAALLLGKLGADAAPAVPALVGLLKDDPRNAIRYSAAMGLGGIGPPARKAVPDLIRALLHDKDGVPREAATALGRIGDPSALPALKKAAATRANEFDGKRAIAEGIERLERAAKKNYQDSRR